MIPNSSQPGNDTRPSVPPEIVSEVANEILFRYGLYLRHAAALDAKHVIESGRNSIAMVTDNLSHNPFDAVSPYGGAAFLRDDHAKPAEALQRYRDWLCPRGPIRIFGCLAAC